MSGIRVEGDTSGNVAEVNAGKHLKIAPQLTPTVDTGIVALAGKNDDGTIVAAGRTNRVYASEGQGLKQAVPVLYWDDTFNATAQNTANYFFGATGAQTAAQTGGFLILNNSSITTASTGCGVKTFKTFPLFAKSELRCNISALFTQAPQANETYEWGLFTVTSEGTGTPTDGVFFRRNTSGELRGIVNYNGTETQTAAMTAPSVSVTHDYVIVVQTNTVLFYIDDVLRGVVTLLTDAPTQGQPIMEASLPLNIRYVIGGSTPALASQIKVSDVFVTVLGPDQGRTWGECKAGFGHMGYQGQNGGTMGTTAQMGNSANPAAAVPTNTTAALGTGLGGIFWETPTLALGTDGIISSFQNPTGGTTQTPRNLIIRGIRVSSVIQTVIAGGPIGRTWFLAFGHNAVSLATAESASFGLSTAKAPRRVLIGHQVITAAQAVATLVAGDNNGALEMRFDGGPIVVAPGEFVAACVRSNTGGTIPTSGTIQHAITFDAYFE